MGSLMPGSLSNQHFQKWSIRIAPSVMTLETRHRPAEGSLASRKRADNKASNYSHFPVSQVKMAVRAPKNMVPKP